MSVSYEEIIAALPRLNRTQLRELRKRCLASLNLVGGGSEEGTGEEDDWLLRGIIVELKNRAIPVMPGFRVRKAGSFKGYDSQAEAVRKVLEDGAPGLDLNGYRALGEVAARELARYITWKSISLEVLLENVGLVPQAFEKAFPGYAEAGLLGLIVRRKSD